MKEKPRWLLYNRFRGQPVQFGQEDRGSRKDVTKGRKQTDLLCDVMCFEPSFREILYLLWRVWGRTNDRNVENQANNKTRHFLIPGTTKCIRKV